MHKIDINNLKDTLLLSIPGVTADPLFNGALIYIYKHSIAAGAEGIIINKPTKLEFYKLFSIVQIEQPIKIGKSALQNKMLLVGGAELTKNTFILDDEFQVGALSEQKLKSILSQDNYDSFEISAGITAWHAGQLEQEIFQGVWFPVRKDKDIMFNTPYQERYHKVIDKLDLSNYFAKMSFYE